MRERETEPHRIRPAALNLSAFTMLDLQFVVLSFTRRLQNRPVLLSVKKLEEYRSLEFSFKHQRLLSFFRSFAIILPSVVGAEVRVRQSSVSSDTHSSTVQWRATVDMKKRRFNSNMIVFYRNWKLFTSIVQPFWMDSVSLMQCSGEPVSTAALTNTYYTCSQITDGIPKDWVYSMLYIWNLLKQSIRSNTRLEQPAGRFTHRRFSLFYIYIYIYSKLLIFWFSGESALQS